MFFSYTRLIVAGVLAIHTLAGAAQINNVRVESDLLRGYKAVVEDSLDTRYYLGVITYDLRLDNEDSIYVNFAINADGNGAPVQIVESSGDLGLVRPANSNDTTQTIFFRCRLQGEPAAAYSVSVTADVKRRGQWAMIDSIINLLTADQKYQVVVGGDGKSFDGSDLAGFGSNDLKVGNDTILGFRMADGPNGVRWPFETEPDPNSDYIYGRGAYSTFFPTEAATANSWDPELAYKVGEGIGKECRAKKVYISLGPMADIVRHPMCGRAFETYGEDPYLNGKLAAAHCRGLHSVKVAATPKHITCYNKEDGRFDYIAKLHIRHLHELNLLPYKMCVDEANVQSMMTSYNQIDIVPLTTYTQLERQEGKLYTAGNYILLKEIVRDQWGYNGILMSDWGGAKASSLKYVYSSTLDIEMPHDATFRELLEQMWANKVPDKEVELKNKLRRLFALRLWANDGKFFRKESEIPGPYNMANLIQSNRNVALEVAEQTITLVRNDAVNGKKLLPINPASNVKIALIGRYAKECRKGGGGSSKVNPQFAVSPWDGFTAQKGSGVTLTEDYASADYAIVFVGTVGETEGTDRTSPDLPPDENALVRTVMAANPNTIVVYTGGSASNENHWSKAPAIMIAFFPGQEQGIAIAKAVFGQINPSGKLAVTFHKNVNQLPSFEYDAAKIIHYPSADSGYGYFYLDRTKQTPLFYFGHGLSYTTYAYRWAGTPAGTAFNRGEQIDVMVSVENTGAMAGKEVVQLYVKPPENGDPRRVKDLRGFTKVELQPGETKTVTMTLQPQDFAYYKFNESTKTGDWHIAPGTYQLLVGASSNDIRHVIDVTLN